MTVQNHIHLDTSVGGSPEYAPTTTFKATKRKLKYEAFISTTRAVTGALNVQVLSDGSNPVVLKSFEYEIRIHSESELDSLAGMLGKEVYLVDHIHPDDGENASSYVRTMHFVGMTDPENIHYNLDDYLVTINLMDKDTVT